MKLILTTSDHSGKLEKTTLLDRDKHFNIMPLRHGKECIVALNCFMDTIELLIEKERAPKYIILLGDYQVYFQNTLSAHPSLKTTILWENK
jgi:hypothetical protein